ncbi:hypothetical protein [Photorhabdus luminescens]|nr:hypothetical protein [Photorhabdus luminescens]MCW7763071.1 hypothetical protein [Photorhabdus luminescens subsp. venezuelensis]
MLIPSLWSETDDHYRGIGCHLGFFDVVFLFLAILTALHVAAVLIC